MQYGATVVPVDFLSSADDAAYILNDCQPELVFYSQVVSENWKKITARLNYKPESILFEESGVEKAEPVTPWEIPYNPENTAVTIYTSGTTGSPKGVMLSFNNLLANLKAVTVDVEIFTPDRPTLMLLPLHHIFPLAGSMMLPLSVGSTVVMSPSMQSSDILETLKNNPVRIMIGVRRLYELLYRSIRAKIDAKAIGRLFTGL